MSDVLLELEELALGSRLKRVADRLMADGAELYRELGYDFRPTWFPVFYLLSERGESRVGALAKEIGVTHVAVNQVLGELEEKGYVRSKKDKKDGRARIVSLSPEGERLAKSLRPVWTGIRTVLKQLADSSGGELLDSLRRLEALLGEASLAERFRKCSVEAVQIVSYQPEFKDEFKEINEAWITHLFGMEEIDRKVLSDPEGEILAHGGQIFFAVNTWTGEVEGTCALMRHAGDWELAKMGVVPEARGRGIGKRLGEAVLTAAREMGLKQVVLETNSSLKPALELYRKLGFVRVPLKSHSDFKRADIRMVVELM